ncbi:hypothetical protein CBP52_08865 [Cellulomonas sp. PSBB021]|nr:hypothetical protein CBP52_08865 [Cellulomonas sp. PSBB021]
MRLSGVALTAILLIGASAPVEPDPRPTTEEQVDALAVLVSVEPSTELDGPVLVAGEVIGAHAGVPVIAKAWPDQETLDRHQPGDAVELVTIAAALTNTDGSFELVADPEAVAEATDGDERIVNFDVTAANAGAKVAMVSTSAVLSPEIAVDDSISGALTDELMIDADEPLTVDEISDTSEVDGIPPVAAEDSAPAGMECGTKLVQRLDRRPTIIGSTYSTAPRVTTQFIYTKGAESTFGIGFSQTGANASWTASSTAKISNGDVDEFDKKAGSHAKIYKKYLNYGKYKSVICDGDFGQIVSYTVRPIGRPFGSYEAGSTVPATPSAYCVRYSSTHHFSKGKAQYWSSGVALPAAMGFNASAQTAYSYESKIIMTRPDGTSYAVCGTGNVPEQVNTGRLVARP